MGIEAVYPFIAVAYGTFGLVFGVCLWWKTQRRIDRTKSAIELQVANAVVDIKAQVTESLDFEVPEFDYAAVSEPLMARLDALETGLPDMVGTHISMAIKGVQATEAKQIGAYIDSLNIEGLTDELKAAAIEKLTLTQRVAHEILTMKIPPKIKRERPLSTMVFEQSRGLVAQAILERESGNVSYDNSGPERSGWNPGIQRR